MTSPDYSAYIDPSYSEDYHDSYNDSPDATQPHILNNKIMVILWVVFFIISLQIYGVIVALLWIIFFIISLHIYGSWPWTPRNRSSNPIHFYNRDQATSTARNVGLSTATIAQLPTFTYTSLTISNPGTGKNAGLLKCAVCLSEFEENEKGRLLPSCKHSFHIQCIDIWFYSHSTCPLCRTVVTPTITNSPLVPLTVTTHEQQQEREEEAPQAEALIAIETPPSAHDSNPLSATAIVNGSDNLAHAEQFPTNVTFCRNSTQLGSPQSSEKPLPTSSAKTTRFMPHITIEVPTRQDINITSPGCLSMSSQRSICSSPHDAGRCSSRTFLKSPGLRGSLKRILSSQSTKGNRVLTSSNQQGSIESLKGTARLQV